MQIGCFILFVICFFLGVGCFTLFSELEEEKKISETYLKRFDEAVREAKEAQKLASQYKEITEQQINYIERMQGH